MLELKNLVKTYTTAGFTQKALDDVTVTLRDNEFVAVLGPSGSGKTTLLNIIGGLDHYDSGDMVIDGISTKEYKDRDWDTYRNNRIGFVFQSYNLIPHQTILSNVELALTLSGVSKEERRQRAKEALEKVGLADHISKKPSQLSGGQMQRVAIARALINDPEILLADEPTGALDSKTSVQIMDMLKEIASDRLVVMVTHNPELADEYANRIIKLSDGKITGDTNPVDEVEEAHEARPPRKAKMSFLTALTLSFSNLMTKKGRTLMMAFAGSIGIIGIAGILALSNGVNNYIKTVEEETLSVYPLSITSTGFDMTSLLVGSTSDTGESDGQEEESNTSSSGFSMFGSSDEDEGTEDDDLIKESAIVSTMFEQVQSNDLASLKEYLEDPQSGIQDYVNTIQYEYNITPQIYQTQTDPEVHQVNPDSTFTALGMGSGMYSSSIMSASMSTNVFDELLADYEIYSEQYEVLAGDWPKESDEIVLVLNSSHRISDLMLYPMGLRDYHDLNGMVEAFINEEEVEVSSESLTFNYDDIMDVEFKLVYNSDYYTYDESYEVWVDRSDEAEYLKELVAGGKTLKICGIVAATEASQTLVLSPGLYYTPQLVEEIIAYSEESEVTQYQLDNPALNIFTNKSFVDEANESSESAFNMDNLMTVDEEAISGAFNMDTSAMNSTDFSNILDVNAVMSQMPQMDLSGALTGITLPAGMEQTLTDVVTASMGTLMGEYTNWVAATIAVDPQADTSFDAYMNSGGSAVLQGLILSGLQAAGVDQQLAGVQAQVEAAMAGYIQGYMTQMLTIMSQQIAANMQYAMSSLSANMANAMSIDTDAFMNAFQFNLDEDELSALMLSMMSGQESSLDGNLSKLGYADYDSPSQISIYPFDFEGKQSILDILDDYNKQMEDEGKEEQVITYTDIVGTLMSSVTTIIDMISMVLVAFVAISLVVSSIMIGVITYISVLERKKEIGILRSIGASKRDIGNVFNAETLIVGFVAGLMGIGIVLLISIPVNIIVLNQFDIANIVLLPPQAALILIGISCLLTFVAGLMPSSAASNKDPVEALRSE